MITIDSVASTNASKPLRGFQRSYLLHSARRIGDIASGLCRSYALYRTGVLLSLPSDTLNNQTI